MRLARHFSVKSVFIVALTLFVVACSASAGFNFPRPTPGSLVLGETTMAQAVAKFGDPFSRRTVQSHHTQTHKPPGLRRAAVPGTFETIMYVYTYASGGPTPSMITTRVRSMSLSFWNGTLVFSSYLSTFADDSTDYDETRTSAFVRGQTTRADVVAALGQPGGEGIYPHVARQGTQLLSYQHYSSGPTRREPTVKNLELLFDASGRLEDIYFANEMRPLLQRDP